jgi:hypothetical protein
MKHTYTIYGCDRNYYRNQLFISILFLVGGMLTMNMCIVPCATAALIYSIEVADANKEKDRDDEAQRYHRLAWNCNRAVFGICVLQFVLFTIGVMAAAVWISPLL